MPVRSRYPDGVGHRSRPLDPPRRLLMGSGPSNPEPRVLQAMAAAPLASDDPAFEALLDDVCALGRAVFQTQAPAAAAVAGASRAGIEAVLASLISPGDRVLVGAFGHFGELLCTLAGRHGARVERVDAQWGDTVDPASFVERVRAAPPRVVALVHADTSTGVLQPLAAIGEACRESGSLLVVDVVLSLGGCPVDVDAWHIDAAIGGLQKCMGGPPGLALVTWSQRAAAVLARRTAPPASRYLDLARVEAAWVRRTGLERTAVSTPMLFAAREALGMVVDEGLQPRWERHRRAGSALRAGLEAMGLELFTSSPDSAPMITLVRVPDGIDEATIRADLLRVHGIEIMAAFGPLRGKVWRIGTMGTNACLPSVLAVLSGLESVLTQHGFGVARGAGVDAALSASGAYTA
jgi:(S)-ureidoglycine---glyoxylate transaminase